MPTDDFDIVYCLKPCLNNEEFRYSLRSLQNIPHKSVWVYGSCPNWVNFNNVHFVPVAQNAATKWLNTKTMLQQISRNPLITKNFIWFNDDFFVLKPISTLDYWHYGTLDERAERTKAGTKDHNMSRYGQRLQQLSAVLTSEKYDTANYELHVPIIFNRHRLGSVLARHPQVELCRSLYCNVYKVGGRKRRDVKIEDLTHKIPDENVFCSTSDASFRSGKIGIQVREMFPQKCEYEASPYGALSFSFGFRHSR